MPSQVLLCPQVGHKLFEKSLRQITLGDVQQPSQTTKFIRAFNCVEDKLGIIFKPGELQRADLQSALAQFAYPNFLFNTFTQYSETFRSSECRVYQFQAPPSASSSLIFGMFITDGSHNLLDFCVESPNQVKRKAVLIKLMRAICSPISVATKLNH